MSNNTLMILGGTRYAFPVIEAARALGCRVVTCDYLPGNPAHKLADEYRNVSITDREAVAEVAQDVGASGIVSFAADPGVIAASFVAEKMGLPFQGSYETTRILQTKSLFRAFLRDNGFNCPWFVHVDSHSEAAALAGDLVYPAIVKPVDSTGSKGVSRVDQAADLAGAVTHALRFSPSGGCIIEEFLEKKWLAGGEAFTVNGTFSCVSFCSQMFHEEADNPYVPAAYILPGDFPADAQQYLIGELQRLADLLELRSGPYSIDVRVAPDGTPYIMELAPRGSGNRLGEFLRKASGVDLIRATVEAALGLPVVDVHQPEYNEVWFQQLLTSDAAGRYEGLWFDPAFKQQHVRDVSPWIEAGTQVGAFTGANFAFGSVFMRFDNDAQLQDYLANSDRLMRVLVK